MIQNCFFLSVLALRNKHTLEWNVLFFFICFGMIMYFNFHWVKVYFGHTECNSLAGHKMIAFHPIDDL